MIVEDKYFNAFGDAFKDVFSQINKVREDYAKKPVVEMVVGDSISNDNNTYDSGDAIQTNSIINKLNPKTILLTSGGVVALILLISFVRKR